MKPEVMLVRALVALAKRNLADANASREGEGSWPAGQEWIDLAGSSQGIFMTRARDEAGIPHGDYHDLIRLLPPDALDEADRLFNE